MAELEGRPAIETVADPTHVPVMRDEVLETLALKPGGVAVDGTLGLAGHAKEMGARVSPGGTLIGFDWDREMMNIAQVRLEGLTEIRIELINSDYREIPTELDRLGVQATGILLDLGLNSAQIDDPSRGIAFSTEGPLDMRMDRSSGEPAAALLNRLAPGEIERGLKEYGDENWARAIAKQIVERRRSKPLRTTTDLVDCVLAAIPPRARETRIHPATRTFQAVRIMVNRELEDLEGAIEGAARCLAPGGRIVVLSYHSGEDRAAKRAFKTLSREGYRDLSDGVKSASAEEIRINPRARSVRFRALARDAEDLSSSAAL